MTVILHMVFISIKTVFSLFFSSKFIDKIQDVYTFTSNIFHLCRCSVQIRIFVLFLTALQEDTTMRCLLSVFFDESIPQSRMPVFHFSVTKLYNIVKPLKPSPYSSHAYRKAIVLWQEICIRCFFRFICGILDTVISQRSGPCTRPIYYAAQTAHYMPALPQIPPGVLPSMRGSGPAAQNIPLPASRYAWRLYGGPLTVPQPPAWSISSSI